MARLSETPSQINLLDVVRGVGRWKTLLISMPLFGLFVGEGILLLNKPTYQTEAQILVQSLATPFDKSTSVAEGGGAESAVNDRLAFSQVNILKSHDTLMRVVDQLKLDQQAEYNTKLAHHGIGGSVMVMLGLRDDPDAFEGKELAAKNLAAKLTIYPVPDTDVVGIKSNGQNPQLAADIANSLADIYVLSTHEVGVSSTERARAWLQQQIDDLRGKVTASESAVEKYRADNNLLAGSASTVSKQQLSELNQQLTVAVSAATDSHAKADEVERLLKQGGRIDLSSDVLASNMVQNLRQQETAAERQVQELAATYLPNHPKMIVAQKNLDAVNVQVRAEAMRVGQSLQSQAKVADQRVQALQNQLNVLKGNQATANFSDVKLQELEREAGANRVLLQNMLARYADANARQDASLQPGYARVIQKASVPSLPYFPKSGPILMLATLGGLIMGLGLAFFLEILAAGGRREVTEEEAGYLAPSRDYRLQNRNAHAMAGADLRNFDVPAFDMPAKAATGLNARRGGNAGDLLGVMPGATTVGSAFTLLDSFKQGKAEAIDVGAKAIAERLTTVKSVKGCAVCTIASIGSQVPNAALATAAAARELAARGEKVITIDFSPSANNLETLLDIPQAPGLIELLNGHADFTKAVTRVAAFGFHIIRLGQPRSPENLAAVTDRLGPVLDALKTIYGYVFLHIGEAGPRTVAQVAASDVAVLLAPDARMADAKAAAEALEENSDARALLMRLEPEATARTVAAA